MTTLEQSLQDTYTQFQQTVEQCVGKGKREAQRAVGSRAPGRHSIKDNVTMFVDEALRKSYQNESEMRAALRKVEDIKQRMQQLCGN